MEKKKWVVVVPKLKTALFGWPPVVELSTKQAKALARYVLGGVEALRTPTYKCASATVTALQKKGLVGINGLTDLGREVGQSLTDEGVV